MSEDKNNSGALVGIRIFLVLAFIAIGYLAFKNYELSQKLKYYASASDEFHENLYAQVEGSFRSGTHTLSISDVYYRKYFKSEDESKNK